MLWCWWVVVQDCQVEVLVTMVQLQEAKHLVVQVVHKELNSGGDYGAAGGAGGAGGNPSLAGGSGAMDLVLVELR
ncbi:MAG: hypothetical protein CM15mL5_2400 [uncultured marine virus]|nr:MAG: hypothetical protein CM15mL5_2400 [uncultured marine virus]